MIAGPSGSAHTNAHANSHTNVPIPPGAIVRNLDFSSQRRLIRARQRELLTSALSTSLILEDRDPCLPPAAVHRPSVAIDSGHLLDLIIERRSVEAGVSTSVIADDKARKLLPLTFQSPFIDPIGLSSKQIGALAEKIWEADVPPAKGRAAKAEWEEDMATAFCTKLRSNEVQGRRSWPTRSLVYDSRNVSPLFSHFGRIDKIRITNVWDKIRSQNLDPRMMHFDGRSTNNTIQNVSPTDS